MFPYSGNTLHYFAQYGVTRSTALADICHVVKNSASEKHALPKGAQEKKSINGAQAIGRAIDVVRIVAQLQRSGATLSRVARAADLKTSTAFRILRTLAQHRMLRYDDGARSYFLGPLAFELGLAASSETPIPEYLRDAIEEVARETQLTTYLMARSDNDAVCVRCIHASTAIRAVPMDTGQRLPLGVGAGSLTILSSLSDEEIQRVIAAQKARLEIFPGGKARPERLLKRIELTRQQGFSFSSGIVASGVIGIGVAISQRRALPHFAISVSAVATSVKPRQVKRIAVVIQTAIERHASN